MSIPSTALSQPLQLSITGMDCASCAKTIERSVASIEGVDDVNVHFATQTLEYHGTAPREALCDRIRQLGYGIAEAGAKEAASNRLEQGSFLSFVWMQFDTRIALLCGILAAVGLTALLLTPPAAVVTAIETALLIIVVVVALPISRKGLRALVFGRQITIDLLMTIATIGALAIGAVGEATAVILLFSLGEALEGYSAARSRRAISSLLSVTPNTAAVIARHRDDDDGHAHADTNEHEHVVSRPVSALQPGDRILVKAGERIPADGIIADGESAIDEAAITGEPLPVRRGIDDAVRAGTLNGDGTLEIIVDRTAEDFLIAHVARLVEQAQNERSPAERYIDRFARWYTPAVVGLAGIVAVVPPLFFNGAFLNPASGETGWLYRGLALLIVACPCALILSIPVTVVSALARLAQYGILVKGGAQLNELAATSVFAFDKTGTLTHGRPTVSGLRSTQCEHDSAAHAACMPCDDVVAVAAAVESGSNHPLASAVMHEADQRQVATRYARASAITTHNGRGVSGTVDGSRITIGNRALAAEHSGIDALLQARTSPQASLMIVSKDEQALGYLEVSDSVRPETVSALQALRRLDSDYRFAMLTGDNAKAADATAKAIGLIDETHSELMPEQKLDKVRELESRYGDVAMVGDGINDTPALAGAKLGVAMGAAGSPQAMESADIVLMRDDLYGLVDAIKISRKTRRRIAENITLSLGLKLVFLALAIPGLATLWMAVVADVGTTLLVTLNGMRILREPPSTLR